MLKHLQKLAEQLHPIKQWPTYDGKLLDRKEFLTSSEVAQCLRKSFYEKNAEGKTFDNNGFAERGHAIEAWFVDRLGVLRNEGYLLEFMGDDQRSFYDADLGLSGTPDGVITLPDTGERVLIEIKSIDPRTNKRNLPKRKHLYQVQQNIMLVNLCLDYDIERAVLIYIDASDVFDQHEFEVKADTAMQREVFDRAATLWAAEADDDLAAEGLVNGDCDNCKFTGQCSGLIERMKAVEKAGASNFSENPPAPVSDEELFVIDNFLRAREIAKEGDALLDKLSGEVKNIILEHGGVVAAGSQMLRVDTSPGRETLDKDMVMMVADKAGVPYDDLLKTGSPFLTLRVVGKK